MRSVVSRRKAMALMGSTLAVPSSLTAADGDMTSVSLARNAEPHRGLSQEFARAALEIARRRDAYRHARIALAPLRDGYVKAVSDGRRSMGWYFRRPEVAAEQDARIALRAGIEGLLRMRAVRRADVDLQLAMLVLFEEEFGDTGGVTRRQFGSHIDDARQSLHEGAGGDTPI